MINKIKWREYIIYLPHPYLAKRKIEKNIYGGDGIRSSWENTSHGMNVCSTSEITASYLAAAVVWHDMVEEYLGPRIDKEKKQAAKKPKEHSITCCGSHGFGELKPKNNMWTPHKVASYKQRINSPSSRVTFFDHHVFF